MYIPSYCIQEHTLDVEHNPDKTKGYIVLKMWHKYIRCTIYEKNKYKMKWQLNEA